MPRPSVKDISNFTYEGTFTWKEALDSGRGLGIFGVMPCREMLTPEGYERETVYSSTQSYIKVVYDKEYIHEFLHRKLIAPIGFMDGENFNKEGFFRFMNEQVEYSLLESKRTSESDMVRYAQELRNKFGKTTEYWLSTLRSAASNKQEEEDNTATDKQTEAVPEKELATAGANGRGKAKA
jgi:hypothetical protein